MITIKDIEEFLDESYALLVEEVQKELPHERTTKVRARIRENRSLKKFIEESKAAKQPLLTPVDYIV